ncbi:MAG: DUF4835 family protein [Cyclobacteriaceae bacterium]|nr:DUF4835 family protein [Cyclobacteriaceae bacterium]
MRKLLLFSFYVIASSAIHAQELNCIVNINVGPRVQTTDRAIFTDMKNAFQQFLNTRRWTNNNYLQHEKINCSILININDMPGIGVFSASVQIQAARPVYNSNYNSLIFNFADRDWDFQYLETIPLEFNDNMFTSNITSMLAYYAYTILGMDHDTFSELGGTPYFQRALQVINTAQQSNQTGWQTIGSIRNRYWLNENMINPQFVEVRKTAYTYHRLALDTFDKDPDNSRTIILKGLREIKKARDINPNAIIIITFFDAKGIELSNIFSEGELNVRKEAYDLMTTMDPTNRSLYDKILKNK